MHQQHDATEVLFFVFVLLPGGMLGMWALFSGIMSVFSGWRWLSRNYRYRGDFRGEVWPMTSGQLGWLKFGAMMTVGASSEGLFLHQALALWHPDLLIPWSDVSARHYRPPLASEKTEFAFERTPYVRLRVSRTLGEELLQQKGHATEQGRSKDQRAP